VGGAPTIEVLGFALLASAFLLLSRFVVVFPLLRLLGLGHRASLLPSINLAQMSEFSMVIAAIGLAANHIGQRAVSILIFVFAFTAVVSTYLIEYNHRLQDWLASLLRRAGLSDLDTSSNDWAATPARAGKDIVRCSASSSKPARWCTSMKWPPKPGSIGCSTGCSSSTSTHRCTKS
jgi:hypothetical protein